MENFLSDSFNRKARRGWLFKSITLILCLDFQTMQLAIEKITCHTFSLVRWFFWVLSCDYEMNGNPSISFALDYILILFRCQTKLGECWVSRGNELGIELQKTINYCLQQNGNQLEFIKVAMKLPDCKRSCSMHSSCSLLSALNRLSVTSLPQTIIFRAKTIIGNSKYTIGVYLEILFFLHCDWLCHFQKKK